MRYRPIRRNSEFGRVYARGKSYVNPALVMYVLKTRGKKTRVGLTATKKIGHAVQRNRARRVMKAAIDEHLDYNIGGYDLVFVARGMTPRLKSWQLSSVVAKLHRRLPQCPRHAGQRRKRLSPPHDRAAKRLQEGTVRADPGVSVHPEPVDRPQLPFYAQLQQLHHAGHHDPWVHQRHPAGGMAHRPVQSPRQMGLRPGAGAGPLAEPCPPPAARKAVFHTAQAKGGKIEDFLCSAGFKSLRDEM